MAYQVLVVGNCVPDNGLLQNMMERSFHVSIQTAASIDEAESQLNGGCIDLVLVNRMFDSTGESGIEWIRAASSETTAPMLIMTNHADQRELAIEAGAAGGFGKSDLYSNSTLDLLSNWLQRKPDAASSS